MTTKVPDSMLVDALSTAEGNALYASKATATPAAAGLMSADDKVKVDRITISAPIDLDDLAADVSALSAGSVFQGNWDASSGSFPGGGTAEIGAYWHVETGGTVDGVTFIAGDQITAIAANASTTTFAANWSKQASSAPVASVAGLTGVITDSGLRTALGLATVATTGAYSDLTGAPSLDFAPETRTITAGAGLSGGGDLTADRTLNIANTTVAAGTYGDASTIPTFTVNARGQLTQVATANVSIAAGAVSGLGTSAALNVPSSGDAGAGQVVKGDDSRLTDARAPTAHTHDYSTLTGLPTLGTMAALDSGTAGTQFRNNTENDARFARLASSNGFSVNQSIATTYPALALVDTDADPALARVGLINTGTQFRIDSGDAALTSSSIDYFIPRDADGATAHVWRVGNVDAARIEPAGETITATDAVVTREKGDARYKRQTIHLHLSHLPGINADGVTDDQAVIQTALDGIARAFDNSYSMPTIHVHGDGLTYAIGAPLVLDEHPFTVLESDLCLSAIGTWDSATYMLNCTGVNALANIGLRINCSLRCNDKTRGLRLENCYRGYHDPTINRMKEIGIYVGNACGVSWIGGVIHEREGEDADFATDNRSATGLWIGPGGGDLKVSSHIGWTHRCCFNEANGPVQFRGVHFYCSVTAPNTPIEGTIYEQAAGCDSSFSQSCYLDTGWIVYRGGRMYIDGSNNLFHLSGATPASITAYIDMVASAPGQSHLLMIDAPDVSDRTKPLARKTEAGGNSWANVPDSWLVGNMDHISRLDRLVFSIAAQTEPAMLVENTDADGCYTEFRDAGTLSAIGSGVLVGCGADDMIGQTGGTERWRVFNSSGIFNSTAGFGVGGVEVLTGQGSAVANATSEADAVTKLNALLAQLRAIGIIAT